MNDPEQSKALVTTEIRVPATLDPAAGSANPFGRAIARRRLSDLNFLPSSRQIKQSGVTDLRDGHRRRLRPSSRLHAPFESGRTIRPAARNYSRRTPTRSQRSVQLDSLSTQFLPPAINFARTRLRPAFLLVDSSVQINFASLQIMQRTSRRRQRALGSHHNVTTADPCDVPGNDYLAAGRQSAVAPQTLLFNG